MISCVKQTGILIIKIAVEQPNNNNTIIKVEVKDLRSLHLRQMGISMKIRKLRKTSTNTIQAIHRVRSVQKTFSETIGKISGTVQV